MAMTTGKDAEIGGLREKRVDAADLLADQNSTEGRETARTQVKTYLAEASFRQVFFSPGEPMQRRQLLVIECDRLTPGSGQLILMVRALLQGSQRRTQLRSRSRLISESSLRTRPCTRQLSCPLGRSDSSHLMAFRTGVPADPEGMFRSIATCQFPDCQTQLLGGCHNRLGFGEGQLPPS